jgi:hypothetical protein
MSDLIGGLYPKPKHENAPDFVIGKLSINVQQFREWIKGWIQDNPGEDWINIDMKVGKSGKAYAALDTWKPEQKDSPPAQAQTAPANEGFRDEIPF